MTMRSIGPHEAKRLMDEGAILLWISGKLTNTRASIFRAAAIWRSRSSTRPSSQPIPAAP